MAFEVPRYSRPQVNPTPVPGARVSSDAPVEAFGGGRAADGPFRQISDAAKDVENILLQEKQKADQVATLEADMMLSAHQTKVLFDPQTGALNKRGKDAFGLPEQVGAEFTKVADEIEKGLSNEQQRQAFRRSRISRQQELDRAIQRHVSGEIRRFDDETTESYLKNEFDGAVANYQDPERVRLSIERQRAAVVDYAKRNGLPEEWVKLRVSDATSKTHTSVVDRMLSVERDLDAKAYYEANKAEFTGQDAGRVEKALEIGSRQGTAQRAVESALTAGYRVVDQTTGQREFYGAPDTEEKLLKRVRELTENEDAATKKLAIAEAKTRWVEIDSARKERQESLFQDLFRLASNGLPISPMQKDQLNDQQQLAIERRIEQIARRQEPQTNLPILTEFEGKSKEEIAQYTDAEMLLLLPHLSEADYKAALNRRQTARDAMAGNGKAQAEWDSLFNDTEMMVNALAQQGAAGIVEGETLESINKSAEKRKAFQDFKRAVDSRFKEFSALNNGKNPDDETRETLIGREAFKLWRKVGVRRSLPWSSRPDLRVAVSELTDEDFSRSYPLEYTQSEWNDQVEYIKAQQVPMTDPEATERKIQKMIVAKRAGRMDLYEAYARESE